MKQIEILAPAGNREMLSAAVFSGADAVYLGFSGFNARSGAGNFDAQTLGEAVSFCHSRGVRVHVAVNTTLYGRELSACADAIRAIAAAGADAVICQDLAVLRLAGEIAPGLARHGSTQMSVHTLEGARQLAEMGCSRVILSRELSFAEIEHITKHCGIETEVFVHGALCMSVSGQCYMSAFLGGRSGNRGSCAGPCRLSFDANPLPEGVPGREHHLSLKDNSLIDRLDRLQAMGVTSAKIEGRLRTPEYVAAAVSACRAGREGHAYDRDLLQKAFSRSGFTSAWADGRIDGSMFGTRSEADAAETRKALPALRELYRRENSRVPVKMRLEIEPEGEKLTVTDENGNRAAAYGDTEPQPARSDPHDAYVRSLSKTGGTPFSVQPQDIEIDMEEPLFLPGAAINELRRAALETLLQKREQPRPVETKPFAVPAFAPRKRPKCAPLRLRFESFAQMPESAPALAEYLIFPLAEAGNIPAELRAKTVLELPRAMFGGLEDKVRAQLAALADAGFAGAEANNIAHFRDAQGLPVFGGLGLNVTNPLAAQEYADMGARALLILPEVKDTDMADITPVREGEPVPTGAMIYGHMPLMLTRACPLQNIRTCAGCPRRGTLTDRKAMKFEVRCALGVRTIYNPVPLYLGEKPGALPVDYRLAYFTIETRDRTDAVLQLIAAQQPFDGAFTRGLYFKGTC